MFLSEKEFLPILAVMEIFINFNFWERIAASRV